MNQYLVCCGDGCNISAFQSVEDCFMFEYDIEFGENRVIRCPHCGVKLDPEQVCWGAEQSDHAPKKEGKQ